MRLSIAAKINFFLLFIFSMVLVFSAAYQAVRERDLILTLIKEQSREQTEAYFDGLNMLMLTGKMDARDTLRGKFLDHAHVEDARIVRGDAVSKQFGPGRETEQVKDEFDELALVGKGSLEVVHNGMHSRLVVTRPLLAKKDFRGTDCTGCHLVPENTVLGAVRFDYSLDSLFTRVEQNILTSALILTGIFGMGLLLTLWVIRTWIVRPLNQLTRSMEEATDLHDFGHRLEGDDGDEIGRVAVAYNQMLDSVERQLGKRTKASRQEPDQPR
ncbi:HAMP domain-containing protein [Aeromonas veronii]|uniref:HAMP domain-containing protein n=1 Tax=Aeromonas veronii TaxID=654 RepID=UPI00226C9011|nr:HAMP domain-containing protein [Aeromonas veronii]MCX9105452.1 HAMP domain-containing protein [Aeromonas veronii]MCX9121089.1 HAMP domain-containing protein [Aeromonas veronii]